LSSGGGDGGWSATSLTWLTSSLYDLQRQIIARDVVVIKIVCSAPVKNYAKDKGAGAFQSQMFKGGLAFRIACIAWMRPFATDVARIAVCVSVYLCVFCSAKAADVTLVLVVTLLFRPL